MLFVGFAFLFCALKKVLYFPCELAVAFRLFQNRQKKLLLSFMLGWCIEFATFFFPYYKLLSIIRVFIVQA